MLKELERLVDEATHPVASTRQPHSVELRLGRRTPLGFDFNLEETLYYRLYGYFFYRNEWVERVFDTNTVYDHCHGEEVVVVSEDGFKERDQRRLLGLHALISTRGGSDFCLASYTTPKADALRPVRAVLPTLHGQDVQRSTVQETVLRFSDALALVFQRRVNLRTMVVSFGVRLAVHVAAPSDEAHVCLRVPPARTLLRMAMEMDEVARTPDEDVGPGAYAEVARRAVERVEDSGLRCEALTPHGTRIYRAPFA